MESSFWPKRKHATHPDHQYPMEPECDVAREKHPMLEAWLTSGLK